MRTNTIRRLLMAGAVFAAVVVVLAGCPLPGTGVTITGWFVAYYFDITSDVTVTVSQGDVSITVSAPVANNGSAETGAFLVAGVPTGTYSVVVTFENDYGYGSSTQYSLDGGDTWQPVDSEIVTGDSAPYTFTITIDSLAIDAGTTIYLDFGNVG